MKSKNVIKGFYPEYELLGYTFVDGTMAFYNSVNRLAGAEVADKVLLDVGCGRGWFMIKDKNNFYANLRNFKGRAKKVIGIDVDTNAASNPTIDEFHLLEIGKPWPVPDNSIDICICDYVMEHVVDVDFFFSELKRVMKTNGLACFRTPNKLSYVALFSSLIPNSLHAKLLKKVQPQRDAEDVFPVVYKCNTKGAFTKTFAKYGFSSSVFYYESEPNYLKFSSITFGIGFFLQKFLPKSLKATIFAFGIKE